MWVRGLWQSSIQTQTRPVWDCHGTADHLGWCQGSQWGGSPMAVPWSVWVWIENLHIGDSPSKGSNCENIPVLIHSRFFNPVSLSQIIETFGSAWGHAMAAIQVTISFCFLCLFFSFQTAKCHGKATSRSGLPDFDRTAKTGPRAATVSLAVRGRGALGGSRSNPIG